MLHDRDLTTIAFEASGEWGLHVNRREIFDADRRVNSQRRLTAHVSDLGCSDLLSEAQTQLCRRAASLAIEAERMEGELSEGKPVDSDVLGRLTGHLGRTYDRLGLQRVARDRIPTINQIMAGHRP